MENKLFKTEKDREDAIFKMQELEVSEGWMLLSSILKENIVALEEALLDPESKASKSELEMLKWRRRYMERLVESPSTLIEQLRNSEGDIMELDPYDK